MSTSFCLIASLGVAFSLWILIYTLINQSNDELIKTICLLFCSSCWLIYALSVRRHHKESIASKRFVDSVVESNHKDNQ